MIRAAFVIVSTFLVSSVNAAELYHCRAYSGGTFWANSHCNKHQGLVDRIVTVPDGMPFDQQVELGRQQLNQRPQMTNNTVVVQQEARTNRKQACDGFRARVAHLDALARQPQSSQMQDWIRGERKKVRDEQFRAQC